MYLDLIQVSAKFKCLAMLLQRKQLNGLQLGPDGILNNVQCQSMLNLNYLLQSVIFLAPLPRVNSS